MDSGDFKFSEEQKDFLNNKEQKELIEAFKKYDLNSNGSIDIKEFKNIMIELGHNDASDEDT